MLQALIFTIISHAPALPAKGAGLGHKADRDWPQDVLDSKMIDSNSAVITLTHDPKIDDEALKIILRASPSTQHVQQQKTHNARRARLGDMDFLML